MDKLPLNMDMGPELPAAHPRPIQNEYPPPRMGTLALWEHFVPMNSARLQVFDSSL